MIAVTECICNERNVVMLSMVGLVALFLGAVWLLVTIGYGIEKWHRGRWVSRRELALLHPADPETAASDSDEMGAP